MASLNRDVFSVVIQYMHIRTKVNCLMVCKQWYEDIMKLTVLTLDEYVLCIRHNLTEFALHMDPSINNNFAIKRAAAQGHTKMVSILLKDPRVHPTHESQQALYDAVGNGRVNVVKLLLNTDNIDPRAHDNLALYAASHHFHTECMKVLLNDKRINVDYDRAYVFHQACSTGDVSLVSQLLEDREIPILDCRHVLNNAVLSGNHHVVRLLLNDNREIPSDRLNYKTLEANTSFEMFETLLAYSRIDPSGDDNHIIRVASTCGRMDVINLVLANKSFRMLKKSKFNIEFIIKTCRATVIERLFADPRIDPSEDNNMAVQLACQSGYVDAVKILLKHPLVDPSVCNNWALQQAVLGRHIKVVRLLMADPRVDPSADNSYAVRVAEQNLDNEMIKLLAR